MSENVALRSGSLALLYGRYLYIRDFRLSRLISSHPRGFLILHLFQKNTFCLPNAC